MFQGSKEYSADWRAEGNQLWHRDKDLLDGRGVNGSCVAVNWGQTNTLDAADSQNFGAFEQNFTVETN